MISITKEDRSFLPDFLIIGAGKSGTTSIHHYLKQHPAIYLSENKEPNFFGYEMHNVDDFEDEATRVHYRNSVTDLEGYLNLFRGASEGQKKGEMSNTYLYHKRAAERIHAYIPDAKLIAIFRQPAERLFSRYLHLARYDRLPTNNFADCLDKESIWWTRHDLVQEGFYYQHLKKFYDFFPKENIKVYLFDDLKKDDKKLIKDMFNFIEVDDSVEVDTSVEYNKSGIIKNRFYDKIFGTETWVRKGIKNVFPQSLYRKMKTIQWMRGFVNKIDAFNLERPKFDPEIRKELTAIYKEDIEQFSHLIDRDLSHWLR